ncbi:MAG: hypothetical protein ACE5OZ_05065 [Candidatus Heimdallarchaeota archaeon]
MAQFAIMHVNFDESAGPVLNLVFKHDLDIPNPILQGVTTTLFTMAIGVGEPTGEPQISIIPVNVPNIRGRTLIFSFGVHNPSARGGQLIEAFMIFVRMTKGSHQDEDKLLRHSIPIIRILEKGAEARIKLQGTSQFDDYFQNLSEALQKILITDLFESTQKDLSDICTEKERAIVSNGVIRAIHNLDLTPELITSGVSVYRFLGVLGESLAEYHGDKALLALPLEIHGYLNKPESEMNLYAEAIESCFASVLTRGDGRTNILGRPLKQILWDLNLSSTKAQPSSFPSSSELIEWPHNLSSPLDTSDGELPKAFDFLSEYSPLFSCYSVFQMRDLDSLTKATGRHIIVSNHEMLSKHQAAAGLFISLNRLCKIMTNGDELRGITIATFGSKMGQILILSWQPGNIMIGESNWGPGLLNLMAEQICRRLSEPSHESTNED